jgi:hypothetical protein
MVEEKQPREKTSDEDRDEFLAHIKYCAQFREKTVDEVRDEFLANVRDYVNFWEYESSRKDSLSKLNGLAFSILALIDGEGGDSPGFILAPAPHPDDKQYNINQGHNYYPENHESDIKCDIGGSLHDLFYEREVAIPDWLFGE